MTDPEDTTTPDWSQLVLELRQLRALKAEIEIYIQLFDDAVDGRKLHGKPITGDDLTHQLAHVRLAMPRPPRIQ